MMRMSGRLRSAVIIGLQGIRARKMRTFLSMISLFLGVLAVVTVQAAAETARTLRLADLELHAGKDGTRQMYLPPISGGTDIAYETLKGKPGAAATFSMNAIIGEPKVRPINPGGAPLDRPDDYGGGYYDGGGGVPIEMVCDGSGNCKAMPAAGAPAAQTKGAAIEVALVGMINDIREFRPFRPVSGQWIDFAGEPSYSPRLVVNKAAAKGFERYQIPAEMRFEGATANPTPRIIGVIDDGNDQPMAYARADEILNWMPPPGPVQKFDPTNSAGMFASGQSLEVMFAPTAGEVESLFVRKLTALNLPREMLHVNVVDARKSIEQELLIVNYIFLGMAGLVLLIGVAGILNVGLATVGERVEEFALRRAVGTPRVLLAGIVLSETLLTGLLTAAAAIGVGIAGLDLAGRILGGRIPQLEHLVFPWQAGVAGVIAGLVAGILGGLIPAIRAARIPIATVMRA